MTHTGDILGTVRYMSPERFRGQCDVRADVYALGMTLYELLTLKPAYTSGDRLKLIELIRQTEAASPRSVDARIPRDLETIVMKAIDKDPKRRYQSADEMGEDLQRFVNDEPIKARRIGLGGAVGPLVPAQPGGGRADGGGAGAHGGGDGGEHLASRGGEPGAGRPGRQERRAGRRAGQGAGPVRAWRRRRSRCSTPASARTCCSRTPSSRSCGRSS